MYASNTSMGNKAFCNNDGDMLILPQQGRMDVQTEYGKLMVRPGELLVIQRGIRFRVAFPDGPSRGCKLPFVIAPSSESLIARLDIQEIYGSHYELPELGPLGGHGLANARDFEHPVASFDIDQSPWEIVYKCVIFPVRSRQTLISAIGCAASFTSASKSIHHSMSLLGMASK